ncbi:YgiT-type zinc finger protein [Salinibacter ruber]|jgi:hypothetical protein|uniref:YgiT-type zinc finger protein n=2 Tax=Salinibacter ruber TaxID=146919 RepID=UPI002074838F|nr:YgiT-type zinc finger protein [Salinibacter ruber]
MEEGTTTLTFHDSPLTELNFGEDPIVVVTAVPAEACDTCGETVIDSATVDHVNELVKDARYLWHRFPDRLQAEGVTVGGEPGEKDGVIRVDYDRTELPVGRANVG